MTEPALLTTWAVCGIAAAAARFVPVPLVDDVIRRRAAQVAVLRTVRAHGSAAPAALFEPLWDDGRTGLRGRLRRIPSKLLLFPVRKYAAVFGAVRGVPNDVARVVLLARTVDRQLDHGRLPAAPRTPEEARSLRRAVDEAIDGMDLRLLTAALADGLSRSRGLTAAAVAFVRRDAATADVDDTADVATDPELSDGAGQVTEALRRPEVTALLERFDARVDDLLTRRR